MKELRKIVGNDICIAIAGNKIDLEKDRHVDTKAALSYAESVGAAHYHTSAKINKGLEEGFGDLSKSKLYGSAMTQIMSNYFPSFSSFFFLVGCPQRSFAPALCLFALTFSTSSAFTA